MVLSTSCLLELLALEAGPDQPLRLVLQHPSPLHHPLRDNAPLFVFVLLLFFGVLGILRLLPVLAVLGVLRGLRVLRGRSVAPSGPEPPAALDDALEDLVPVEDPGEEVTLRESAGSAHGCVSRQSTTLFIYLFFK